MGTKGLGCLLDLGPRLTTTMLLFLVYLAYVMLLAFGGNSGASKRIAAIIGVLTAIEYDANISRTFAFTLHASNVLITSVMGGIALLREGMSFTQVASEARALRSQSSEEAPQQEAASQ